MAMSVGQAEEGDNVPMSDINTTPLVDVMLVLLIIFLIAIPVAIQTIEKLKIPVMPSVESKDKVENLLLTVSTSDDAGRSAGEPGFAGASRNGECRVYFNNTTPVDSQELYDKAFERLDAIVQAAGGPEAKEARAKKLAELIRSGAPAHRSRHAPGGWRTGEGHKARRVVRVSELLVAAVAHGP